MIREVIWDKGMPQQSTQYVDENGKTVEPPKDERQIKQIWDKGTPFETIEYY